MTLQHLSSNCAAHVKNWAVLAVRGTHFSLCLSFFNSTKSTTYFLRDGGKVKFLQLLPPTSPPRRRKINQATLALNL